MQNSYEFVSLLFNSLRIASFLEDTEKNVEKQTRRLAIARIKIVCRPK